MEVDFITQEVVVEFDQAPRFSRRPSCPNRFIWDRKTYTITQLLSEWRHANSPRVSAAKKRLGIARIYFRVETDHSRTFDLYYDPAGDGRWVLSKEIFMD